MGISGQSKANPETYDEGGVSIIGRKTRDLRRKRFTFLGGKQGQSWHQDPTEWDKSEHPLRTGHLVSLSVPSPLNPFPFLMLMLKKTKPLLSWVELSWVVPSITPPTMSAQLPPAQLTCELHFIACRFVLGPSLLLWAQAQGLDFYS